MLNFESEGEKEPHRCVTTAAATWFYPSLLCNQAAVFTNRGPKQGVMPLQRLLLTRAGEHVAIVFLDVVGNM